MVSVTSWTRLEPRTRSEDLRRPLQAQVHDPLWLLARQWQFGEFQAEDAGSPIIARLRAEATILSRYHPHAPAPGATVPGAAYDKEVCPLEIQVERGVVRHDTAAKDWRQAAEAGQYLLQLLSSNGLGRYRAVLVEAFGLEPPTDNEGVVLDDGSLRFLRVVGRRVPDGDRLYAALENLTRTEEGIPTDLPPELGVQPGDVDVTKRVIGQWLAWYESLISEADADGDTAWDPERMEYAFAVAAPTAQGETTLVADEYHGGHLDWYAFDLAPDTGLGAEPKAASSKVLTRLPTPVSYRGMPASRWWEFEDEAVNFSHVEAGAQDLLRLLFLEFALIYSDDWFMIPVEVEVGSLYRTRSLVVTDTFGERTLIPHYGEAPDARDDWGLFYPSRRSQQAGQSPSQPENLFFLPPTRLTDLHGPAVEEVLFLRDEMANMAWAVERIVTGATGAPVRRFERYQEKRSRATTASPETTAEDAGATRYVLATEVPDYWVPLVPQRIEADAPDIRLRRARMLLGESDVLGRILQPGEPLSLYEEEVPRTGARVTRAYEYTRWINGSTQLWVGRCKRPGRGEGWSGLRFDATYP